MDTEYLYINSRDELLRLDISKIVYFEASGNYTTIVLSNKLKNIANMNLGQTEKALESGLREKSRCFARIGKRFIINLNYVYDINVAKQTLTLTNFTTFAYQMPVGKDTLRKLKDIYTNVKS